jgi:hypothetical protein
MKKIVAVGVGLIILLFVGIYFFFPRMVFKMAEMGERYRAGLVKNEIQVDDHKIVYLEGRERANDFAVAWFRRQQRALDAVRKVPDR